MKTLAIVAALFLSACSSVTPSGIQFYEPATGPKRAMTAEIETNDSIFGLTRRATIRADGEPLCTLSVPGTAHTTLDGQTAACECRRERRCWINSAGTNAGCAEGRSPRCIVYVDGKQAADFLVVTEDDDEDDADD